MSNKTEYTISVDLTSLGANTLDVVCVQGEINQSGALTAAVLEGVLRGKDATGLPNADKLLIYTTNPVSAAERTALDAVIAAYPAGTFTPAVPPGNETTLNGSYQVWNTTTSFHIGTHLDEKTIYAPVTLPAGTYTGFKVAQKSGGSSNRCFDVGLYADDGTQRKPTGTPLASTGMLGTSSSGNNAMVERTLTSALVLTEPGRYWLALVADTESLKFYQSYKQYKPFLGITYLVKDHREAALGVAPTTFDSKDYYVPYMEIVRSS